MKTSVSIPARLVSESVASGKTELGFIPLCSQCLLCGLCGFIDRSEPKGFTKGVRPWYNLNQFERRGTLMKRVFCTLVLLSVLCSIAFAGYWDDVSQKADRGFSNVLGCWLELPYQCYTVPKEKGIMMAPLGLGKGVVMVPLRVLSGVVDLATFPMPLPRVEWKGLLQPEYNPWVESPDEPLQQKAPDAPPPPEGQPAVVK
jgi:putative exosortase-associated protein (TIGR04073 family)